MMQSSPVSHHYLPLWMMREMTLINFITVTGYLDTSSRIGIGENFSCH
jgi:hypothetical protein